MIKEDGRQYVNRDELKQEIKAELSHESWRRVLTAAVVYLVIFAVLLLVPVLGLTTMAARSGLLKVPLLSDWLYHPDPPERTVLPLAGTDPNDIMSIVAARTSFNSTTETLDMTISEQELTTLLSGVVLSESEVSNLPLPIESVQTSFGDGLINVYALTGEDYNSVPLSIRLRPAVVGGLVWLEAEDLTVGSLSVPDAIANLMIKSVNVSLNKAIEQGLGENGELQSIVVAGDKIKVSLVSGH
ncbi:hypothetical protein COY93_03585 [Candidatus Uhrbacteria bacterium CG_4_10_14_0_8_um_filter_58_22]|uniref:Uncharacterized protein n=1 Tax=Candidatus Uhrbacteria bacterium CG_4_10_14_0_8_um_filter_58_22 TaxID=1975029 RepID=A0A2M7QA60_9BACT|nr:MAG: hypothetical protein AUJ19_05075 [Parcubacteria group bacterium CG1_02_58_44]PIY62210.1 MAG: hypothetical protein COY93_03585 [Candidatus Uhrbacteria bacterium CG_4_10_14_0_8_um_filter_58_22]